MKVKTGKILLTMLATRPMWGMIPLRVIFGVILILEGVSRFTMAKNGSEALIGQIPGDFALALIVFFFLVEILSGIFSIAGLAQRAVGLIIVLEMSLAIFVERIPLDFTRDLTTQVLLFAIGSLVLFSGAGRFSMDRFFCKKVIEKISL